MEMVRGAEKSTQHLAAIPEASGSIHVDAVIQRLGFCCGQ